MAVAGLCARGRGGVGFARCKLHILTWEEGLLYSFMTTPRPCAGWAAYMAACFFAPHRVSSQHMGRRSIIYIDGFNLYYGAVKGTANKWLDIQRMCQRLRHDDDVQQIRYFTALVDGPTRPNQETYLKALESCSMLQVVLGKFKSKRFRCRVAECKHPGRRFYMGTEEKRTDVAIAVMLLDDAYQDRADRFIIVSGDSDLVPAVNLVKQRFPKKTVIVYVPSRSPLRGAAVELRTAADKHRTLPLGLVSKSQFPPTMADGHGGVLRKPADW